jgi:hypothetical protein
MDRKLAAQALEHGLARWDPTGSASQENAEREETEVNARHAAAIGSFAGLRGSSEPEPEAPAAAPVQLSMVSGAEELEALGLDALKEELRRRGLKCGGTLAERAARLWQARFGKKDDPRLQPSKKRARESKPPSRQPGDFVRQQGPLLPGVRRLPGQKSIRSHSAGLANLAARTADFQAGDWEEPRDSDEDR